MLPCACELPCRRIFFRFSSNSWFSPVASAKKMAPRMYFDRSHYCTFRLEGTNSHDNWREAQNATAFRVWPTKLRAREINSVVGLEESTKTIWLLFFIHTVPILVRSLLFRRLFVCGVSAFGLSCARRPGRKEEARAMLFWLRWDCKLWPVEIWICMT